MDRLELLHCPQQRVIARERAVERTLPDRPARDSAEGYDSVDRRLIDTFPASDAVARY